MIPRLTLCFGLSVLLHGVLLLTVAPAFHKGGKVGAQTGNTGSAKMEVFLDSANDQTAPSALSPAPGKHAQAETVPLAQAVPEESPPQPAASPSAPPLSPGWFIPPPEQQNPAQMSLRQAYEMQARMQAMQQAQMFSARLQADIEQSLNQHDRPVPGKCIWEKTTSRLACDSQALERRMHEESARLTALRSSIQTQGRIPEGFVIGSAGDRVTFTLLWHTADSTSP